jgi:hypothetical protein
MDSSIFRKFPQTNTNFVQFFALYELTRQIMDSSIFRKFPQTNTNFVQFFALYELTPWLTPMFRLNYEPQSFEPSGQQKQYTVKKVSDFPVPSRDVTNQTFPGRENR